jgi:hypothetical protein
MIGKVSVGSANSLEYNSNREGFLNRIHSGTDTEALN